MSVFTVMLSNADQFGQQFFLDNGGVQLQLPRYTASGIDR